MKILAGLITLISLSLTALAQDITKHDPLIEPSGSYPVFANSAEFIHITIPDGQQHIIRHDLYDFRPNGYISANWTGSLDDSLGLSIEKRMDYVAADVNGDGKDKLFISRANTSNLLEFSVNSPNKLPDWPFWTWDSTYVLEFPEDTVAGPIRLIAAYLDTIPGKELIECFPSTSALKGYWYNSFNDITQTPNNRNLLFEHLYSNVDIQEFDLTAGDIDGDGLDEIIIFFHSIQTGLNWIFFEVWKYNPGSNSMQMIFTTNRNADAVPWNSISRLKITSGDFLNKGFDDLVISATHKNGNNGRQVFSYVTIDLDDNTLILEDPILGNVPDGWSWGNGWETNAVSADLNPLKMDGDELVVAGPSELAIIKFNSTGLPSYITRILPHPSAFPGPKPHAWRKFLAVADVDADTSASSWTPEIMLAVHELSFDSLTFFQKVHVDISDSNDITGLTLWHSSPVSIKSSFSEIVMGDFDGDAIRLGAPKLVTKEFVYQPIVQLNVPPTHFDYLNGQVYDICKVHSGIPSEFSVTYTETESATSRFSSELSHSWGVSGELSGGTSLYGVKVKAYVKAAYDQGYYGSQTFDTTVTTTQVIHSTGDDWLLATVTDYDLWEYPINAMGNQMGNVLIMIPHYRGPVWFPKRNVIARNWMADHEVGNLFSYPRKDDISNWVNDDRLLTTFNGKFVSQASSGSWMLNLATQQIDDEMLTSAIGAEVGLSVKYWGIEAKVSGRYSREEITTHTSTAAKEVEIEVIVSETDITFGDTDYLVTPYIYWGQNGAMVIDYAVDPSSLGDSLYGTFWDQNYLSHSDPGFILPWRLDSLKGIGNTGNMKLYNKSLRVSPVAPQAGDTAYITANIHNFSLKNTDGPVTARFYLGNPSNGGTPIVGINGLTDFSTDGPIMKQGRSNIQTEWIVPSGLSDNSTVYAVIDPDNTITEIHEDNNIGFVPLRGQGATDIENENNNPLPDKYALQQNYPNPFNPSTTISWQSPVSSWQTLKVYDVLGNEIVTLVDEYRNAGSYEIEFNLRRVSGTALASGVYFYRLQAGSFIETKKMILVK